MRRFPWYWTACQIGLLVVSLIIFGCARQAPAVHTMMEKYASPKGGDKAPAFSAAPEDDVFRQKLLTSNADKSEARAWLKQIEHDNKRRLIGNGEDNVKAVELLEFVNGLYSAGTVAVTAIDLEIDPNV